MWYWKVYIDNELIGETPPFDIEESSSSIVTEERLGIVLRYIKERGPLDKKTIEYELNKVQQ